MSDEALIPYGRQCIDDADLKAVNDVLQSDYLTTGPAVATFEAAVATYTGATHGVAVNSGTAALHAAMDALGIGPGDEVIVPAITFAATANAVLYAGGTPRFADVEAETLLIDPASVERLIGAQTKAIVAVDYAGQPCDYDRLRALARQHGLALVADGCHALGACWRDEPVGSLADITAFSFHPVKHLTTGEGGMAVTQNPSYAAAMRRFRNHGIDKPPDQRQSFHYEMVDLGYNYRLTDIQCALGLSQLAKQSAWLERRRAIARAYDGAFADLPGITPLTVRESASPAWHLYVIRIGAAAELDRLAAYEALRAARIGVNVHYLPVYLHPYYQQLGYPRGLCPTAEAAYDEIISLPMYPGLTDAEVARVIAAVHGLRNRA